MKALTVFSVFVIFMFFLISCEKPIRNNPWDENADPATWSPTDLVIVINSTTSITLIWQDNSTNEEGFVIDRKVNEEFWVHEFATVTDNKTSFVDNNVQLKNYYTYKVYAFAGQSVSLSVEHGFSFINAIGDTCEGGIVFYLDGSGGGLVCALNDQSNDAQWGCYGTSIDGTSTNIGKGSTNTDRIVTGCNKSGIAARISNDLIMNGYNDWFLPSKDELNLMYQNLKLAGIGGFSDFNYWSSSEATSNYAWSQDFSHGYQTREDKNFQKSVRVVRSF